METKPFPRAFRLPEINALISLAVSSIRFGEGGVGTVGSLGGGASSETGEGVGRAGGGSLWLGDSNSIPPRADGGLLVLGHLHLGNLLRLRASVEADDKRDRQQNQENDDQ